MRFLKIIQQCIIATHNKFMKDKTNNMLPFNSIYYQYLLNNNKEAIIKISVPSSQVTMTMNVGQSCHLMMSMTNNGLVENVGQIIEIRIFNIKRRMIIRYI